MSTATAHSETWSLVGANELGLKKELIPLLHQIEVSLGRMVCLRGEKITLNASLLSSAGIALPFGICSGIVD
jgi:hypothetical protein